MTTARPRLSAPALRLLAEMLVDPTTPLYGLDLMDRTGVRSGTLYPLLARLAAAGWLTASKEDIDTSKAGRPARTYYQLTADGVHEASEALAGLMPAGPQLGWAGA